MQDDRTTLAVLAAVAACACCGGAGAQTISVHTAARGLQLPVAIVPGPPSAGHGMLYIAERAGTVRLVNATTGAVVPAPVLTVSQPVSLFSDAGLQCIALSPPGPGPRYMYAYYNTAPTTALLERHTLTPDGTFAVAGSVQTVLRYQRAAGHNGGWLGFSPVDGYLYLSLGDGGFAANPDPTNAAQSLSGTTAFQGKVLRIDPSGDDFPADADRNYRIPPTNPFVGVDGDDEIWDYGLRNPWRCCFDPANGDFWIADVGQETWEEINLERQGTPSASGGHNYGWKCFEGVHFTGYAPCTPALPFTPPLAVYGHDESGGCSITGGIVYRGAAIPALVG
ncbi:MAG TPA: PQQ-dependent sugar dehydrogenase, partial [Phycisphaerales bacterium]|nr:PQQ-dependent sugar dehydrogenase [Phycisphaerales bacterium]